MQPYGEIIAGWAQQGAKHGDCGKMCHDCAFRVQPDINYYSETVQSIAELLAYGNGEMNCHTADYQNAGRPCVGFLYAKQYLKSLENAENDTIRESQGDRG